MKKIIIILASFLILSLISCNEESLIEGRVPTNPVTIEINEEIQKGLQKSINLNIEGVNYKINANYYYQLSGNTEIRQVSINTFNSTNYIIFYPNGTNIGIIENGKEINSLFNSTQIIYSGMFLYSLNTLNNTNYTYYTINNVKMDTNYFIPFKTYQTNTQSQEAIYGWLLANVSSNKMTIYKCVYRKTGVIKAGEE